MKSPKNSVIRPTSDKVRSAIFSKIYNKIENASVLDLFAGTGSFGIEALSRGAKVSYFIDKNVSLIKENIKILNLAIKSKVIKGVIPNILTKIKHEFDIIFIDPPYQKINSKNLLKEIFNNQLIANNGILIYEESIKTEFEICDEFEVFDTKKYGDTKIYFLEIKK